MERRAPPVPSAKVAERRTERRSRKRVSFVSFVQVGDPFHTPRLVGALLGAALGQGRCAQFKLDLGWPLHLEEGQADGLRKLHSTVYLRLLHRLRTLRCLGQRYLVLVPLVRHPLLVIDVLELSPVLVRRLGLPHSDVGRGGRGQPARIRIRDRRRGPHVD